MGSARLIGINHVALEVGDLDAALELYGRLFAFELRGRVPGMAFLDLGDQFLAVAEGRRPGIEPHGGRGLRFDDPWGNSSRSSSTPTCSSPRSRACCGPASTSVTSMGSWPIEVTLVASRGLAPASYPARR